MADKSIVERIKKLLALAKDNPNAAEATAAALKAQKLIADNDVSKAELHEGEKEEITEVTNENNLKGQPWAKRLAGVIADNFRCIYYIHYEGTRSYWTGRTSKTDERIVFMGYDTDAVAAQVTFDRLYEIGSRLAGKEVRRARTENGSSSGVKNSFLLGFVKGIREELEKQCVALMLVRPKEVDDYAEERTRGFASSRSSVRNASYNAAYDSGRAAGHDSVRSARLSGQKALAR